MYRNIHTEIWTDAWFLGLDPQAKLLFIYLFSNERTNLAGLYNIVPQVISWHTGIEEKVVIRHLDAFGKAGKAHYEDGWLWIPNFLVRNTSLRSQKVRINIDRTLASIPDMPLKHKWVQHFNTVLAPQYGVGKLEMAFPVNLPEKPGRPQAPANLPGWLELLKDEPNKQGVLHDMFVTLFPQHDPPTFQYVTRAAKTVGGAGRMAQLLWIAAGRQVTGDPLAYCMAAAKSIDGGSHGTGRSGGGSRGNTESAAGGALAEPSEFYSAEELAGLESD